MSVDQPCHHRVPPAQPFSFSLIQVASGGGDEHRWRSTVAGTHSDRLGKTF